MSATTENRELARTEGDTILHRVPHSGFWRSVARALGSCLTGLGVTGRYLARLGDRKPITLPYLGTPETSGGHDSFVSPSGTSVQPRFRGHLYNDLPKCIACQACARACPIDCIWIEIERDEKNKPRASRFDVDLTRCMYCGLCVRACPTDSLSMLPRFEIFGAPGTKGETYIWRLDAEEVARRRLAGETPRAIGEHESFVSPSRRFLIAVQGYGFYSPEELARVAAAQEELKRQKAEAAAKAKAAKAAAPESKIQNPKSQSPAPLAPSPAPPAPPPVALEQLRGESSE